MASVRGEIQVLEWEGPLEGEDDVVESGGERCSAMRRRMSTGRDVKGRDCGGRERVRECAEIDGERFDGGEVVDRSRARRS